MTAYTDTRAAVLVHPVAGEHKGSYDATALHAAIMNLPSIGALAYGTVMERLAYKDGHKDARHAAAELVASTGEAGAQQQDDHAGSPAPSEPVAWMGRCPVGGHKVLWTDPEGMDDAVPLYTHSAPSAESSKELHYPSGKTAEELWLDTGRLRSQLADMKAESSKAALSDDEVLNLARESGFTEADTRNVPNKLKGFARAILARAGITRKPLTEQAIREASYVFLYPGAFVDGVRFAERAHGITPQAGKESGE